MHILITGGAGFIGSHLADDLIARGHRVRALDIPAMTIGLPNNLSPFVEAGAIAGAAQPADAETLLRRILYHEEFRHELAAARRAVFGQPVRARELRAAARSADTLLGLVDDERPGAARAG